MVIDDVPYQYVEADVEGSGATKTIRPGDLVFTAPGQLGLPVPLVVGKVTAIETDLKKRLVFTVVVEPAAAIDEIRDVFVIPLVPAGFLSMQE
jgi:cell shape-determining protein MreC